MCCVAGDEDAAFVHGRDGVVVEVKDGPLVGGGISVSLVSAIWRMMCTKE